jgi:hypothetical protein
MSRMVECARTVNVNVPTERKIAMEHARTSRWMTTTAEHADGSATPRLEKSAMMESANALTGQSFAREVASARRTSRTILITVDHAERSATRRLGRYARTEVVSVLTERRLTLRRTKRTVENAETHASLKREKNARTENVNALMDRNPSSRRIKITAEVVDTVVRIRKDAKRESARKNEKASCTAQPSDLKEKVVSFVIPLLAYHKRSKNM